MPWKRVGDPMVGPPGTIDIVETTNLPPGSSATATISGTPAARKLTLGVPAGLPGDVGLESMTVSSATTINVEINHTYELTVSGNPQIRLTTPGNLAGSQAAIYVSGPAVIEGYPVDRGAWVAWLLSTGWIVVKVELPQIEITATSPIWDDAIGTYTLASQAGVTWRVGGASRAPGTYSADAPASITVTASPRPGFVLVGPASWTHAFPAPAVVPKAPTQVSGLTHWHDMSDTSTVTLVDGKVSTVADKAGSVLLRAVSAATRPTYADVGALKGAQINSGALPNAANGLTADTTAVLPNSTTIMAFRFDAAAVNTGFNAVYKWSGASFQVGGEGSLYIGHINTNSQFPTFNKFQAGQIATVAYRLSGTTITVFVDGEPIGTSGTASASGMNQITLGNPYGSAGWSTALETVTYNRSDVSATDIRSLHAHLKVKWGAR